MNSAWQCELITIQNSTKKDTSIYLYLIFEREGILSTVPSDTISGLVI